MSQHTTTFTPATAADADLYYYVLRQADTAMVLCQRLCEWVAKGPELEEDIALTNIGLDLIGQARSLYQYAAECSGQPITDDDLVFQRNERQWVNCLLVEQPNGNFADTIVRQYFFDAWHKAFLTQLTTSKDETLAAVAAKSVKESAYHLRHSSSWVERLGAGTELSNERAQKAVDDLWAFTYELLTPDELDERMQVRGVGADLVAIRADWERSVHQHLTRSELAVPSEVFPATGGRNGVHSQHMGYLLAEMQILARSMPGCEW